MPFLNVLSGIEKWFYHLPQSQNNCTKYPVLSKPTLLWSSLADYHEDQPRTRQSQEPSDLSGLKPDGPPWVSLVLSACGSLFRGPVSHLTAPYDLGGLDQNSLPLACRKIPLSVSLGRLTYIIYHACHCIFWIPTHLSFLFFSRSTFSSKYTVQQPSVQQLLFNHLFD
jgi:hypothetical protein